MTMNNNVIVSCPEMLRMLEKRIGGNISCTHCSNLVERLKYLEIVLYGKERPNTLPLVTRLEELEERVCYVEQQLIRKNGDEQSQFHFTIFNLLESIENNNPCVKCLALWERLLLQGIN